MALSIPECDLLAIIEHTYGSRWLLMTPSVSSNLPLILSHHYHCKLIVQPTSNVVVVKGTSLAVM